MLERGKRDRSPFLADGYDYCPSCFGAGELYAQVDVDVFDAQTCPECDGAGEVRVYPVPATMEQVAAICCPVVKVAS